MIRKAEAIDSGKIRLIRYRLGHDVTSREATMLSSSSSLRTCLYVYIIIERLKSVVGGTMLVRPSFNDKRNVEERGGGGGKILSFSLSQSLSLTL